MIYTTWGAWFLAYWWLWAIIGTAGGYELYRVARGEWSLTITRMSRDLAVRWGPGRGPDLLKTWLPWAAMAGAALLVSHCWFRFP